MTVRFAVPADARALLRIYAPYVEKTAITFEYVVPSEIEFARRIAAISEKYPYLALEDGGEILGYAYAAPFKERAAYDWAVETTIYLRPDARGKGCGRTLYEALEENLRAQHILNANACIAYTEVEDETLTNASMRFHQKMGYQLVGHFHQCGYKFGRWYDMIWMEKLLGPHDTPPLPIIGPGVKK